MTVKIDMGGNVVQASRPALVQNITVGASSVQSNPFSTAASDWVYSPDGTLMAGNTNNTAHIRLVSTTNCWVAFGSNPTAAASAGSIYIPAYVPEYFYVVPGERIAVIQDSAGGTLNIGECVQ